jgi:hypothetical protein
MHKPASRRTVRGLKWVLMAFVFLSPVHCQAQESSRCNGNRTVEDAWGTKVASETIAFLTQLQRALRAGDKKQIASPVHYPLRVFDGSLTIEISSPSDLVTRYSSVFSRDVRQAILTQSGECLFGNDQGMMIGNGQVWFELESSGEMKIITINKIGQTEGLLPQGNADEAPVANGPNVPSFVFGRWKIVGFVEVGGHAAEPKERARTEIGRSFTIGAHSFEHDRDFLYYENAACKNPSYRMTNENGDKGSLAFYALKQADKGKFLIVSCGNRSSYSVELAKDHHLAVYYDGWFFFLTKF